MHHGYDLDKLYDKLNLTGKVRRIGEFSVGAGGCSNVWEGYCEGRKVAVKVIREVGVSSNELSLKRRLVREVRAWSDLHHRNILPLLGFAYGLGSRLASLVSPWMPHGTSKRYLETRSPGEKIRILTNVADGLCYLHRYDVVHGDIKGDNILIDESFEPRLADFGLSKIVSESKAVGDTITHTQGFFGSIRWTAKELFSSPEEFGPPCVTKESDIWAFGMTILELFTSLPPYHKIRSDPQVIIAIHNGRLPEQPDGDCGLDDDMWALCTSCWAENPALRPTTKSLAKRLWELEVKFKLMKAQRKKRKSRDPDSPDKENGESSIEQRLKKSPKLSTLELDGGRSSPGTPRSISTSSREIVRTPSSGAISRSSSYASIPSSSSSDSSGVHDIDPRKLFAGQARSDWAVNPAWNAQVSRSRPERTQTEPVATQRYDYPQTYYSNEIKRPKLSVDGMPDTGASHSLPNCPQFGNSDEYHPFHTNASAYPYNGGSGLQLEGLGSQENIISPYFQPFDEMTASQWTSFPGQFAPHTPANSFDSQISPSAMYTPLASQAYPPSPSPSPFMPLDPIFSDSFPMGYSEEPMPLDNFMSSTIYGNSIVNPVDFVTMPHGVLSPAVSDMGTPMFGGYTEEPSHIPNPSDTPVIGSYDPDDFGELESDFALFGGVSVDENVLSSRPFEMKSSASTPSSRQGSASTVTGASSCSSQSSRQSSSGTPSGIDRIPSTLQLSPLLSSF